MFSSAQQFNTPLGSWDVSRVTSMQQSEYIRVWDIVHHIHHCITIVEHNATYTMYCLSDECMNILTLPHNHVIVYIVVLYHHHHHHPQCFLKLFNLIRIHSVVHYGWKVQLIRVECSLGLRKDPSHPLHVVQWGCIGFKGRVSAQDAI